MPPWRGLSARALGRALFWLAIAFSTFQIAGGASDRHASQIARAIHVGFLMALGFPMLAYARHGAVAAATLTLGFAVVGIAVAAYQWIEYTELCCARASAAARRLVRGRGADRGLCRRRMLMGPALPIISGLFLAYALLGSIPALAAEPPRL